MNIKLGNNGPVLNMDAVGAEIPKDTFPGIRADRRGGYRSFDSNLNIMQSSW